MYVPSFTAIDDEQARGWLATNSPDGADSPPAATLMPILWRDDTVIAHMAKANPHWRAITDAAPGLFIVSGPEAYISPSRYASKAEHGKVVPTWNYVAVHLIGTVRIHRDPEWVLNAVTMLTDRHERPRAEPWQVSDAPSDYVEALLNAIVGVEMRVTSVDGKAKLSQNRSATDRAGV
ncbi:MAG TPA: FMN-binding negative transcriptional regulator, partial [Ilumatobacteraceae bacterium]|nr:FMN-binding negative transcriptional regulator [Ilumatobacteraceae bacterium]